MTMQTSETPVLDLVATMTAESIQASTLDPQQLMLVRIAALVAVDAPPISYLLNLGAATDVDIGVDEVRGILTAVAPIVGTPKVVAASSNMAHALGIALEVAELEEAGAGAGDEEDEFTDRA